MATQRLYWIGKILGQMLAISQKMSPAVSLALTQIPVKKNSLFPQIHPRSTVFPPGKIRFRSLYFKTLPEI
jgi:hypothetical protein